MRFSSGIFGAVGEAAEPIAPGVCAWERSIMDAEGEKKAAFFMRDNGFTTPS